ncbi:hypothetical protein OROGR_016199 [Orobanche gracilis]
MPPEHLPWDRRDFGKHDRSGPDHRFTGRGFGGNGQHKWREQHHHPHPPPYHHHYNHPQQQRLYSDFRSCRPIPPGYGKQGGWDMYPDGAGHGVPPFGYRYGDRNLEDDHFRTFVSGGEGRYFRYSRENRGSFSQKDFRSPSWEPPVASSGGPGRPNTEVNNQKSVENTQACHNSSKGNNLENIQICHNNSCKSNNLENIQICHNSCKSNNSENTHTCHNNNSKGNKNPDNTQTCRNNSSNGSDSPCPLPDSLSGQSQAVVKEKNEKDEGTANVPASPDQKSDKENSLGPTDCKMKWGQSGVFSSRSSGFSRSSSSKSVGVDSIEKVAEVQQKNASPVNSPAAAVCVEVAALAPSDDTSSRKKPRLGWGEGLAKYEKKKVEGPEDVAFKDALVNGISTTQTMQPPSVNPLDKSPKVENVLLDCASPPTPSSVACSSSPGCLTFSRNPRILWNNEEGSEEKVSIKTVNIDHDPANVSFSPSIMSQTHCEKPTSNLENLDLASIASLSSLINEMVQSYDPNCVETDYVRTTTMNKLLVWKVGILKVLEVTESEIDSLETELKSLIGSCCPHPVISSLLQEKCHSEPCEQVMTSSTVTPASLKVASGDMVVENRPAVNDDEHGALKDVDIDSPGSTTSKLAEALDPGQGTFHSETPECVEGFGNEGSDNSSYLESSEDGLSDEDTDIHFHVDHIYDAILASNKDSANRALAELNKLLPALQCSFDVLAAAKVSSLQMDSSVIKERFLMRKRALLFKEKVITLKFKVFQHFWRKGRIVSLSKLRGKYHKKLDICRTGYKKNRSSSRSRISYCAGVPAEEVIEFINGLLAESPIKRCRSTLKMPALILDKQVKMSRFISNNPLVEDPCAAEKERSMINPWTAVETEMFIDKLAVFGKDFSKIASFLEHRTIADCIEFYYKNHKSECFQRAKPLVSKQTKPQSNTYLVANRKRWNHEANAASLEILGEASVVAGNVNNDGVGTQQKCASRIFLGPSNSQKAPRGNDDQFERSNSLDNNEAVAADVLAGICGSLSSEAVSSCITSSVDPTDGQDWKCQRLSSCIKRPLTPDVTQNVDGECSDESCGEMDPTDWTDEEKSFFVQAVSSYGKDFAMISECLRTRSVEQCKIFFSKARKCLGLDGITPGAGTGAVCGDGSDTEDAFVLMAGPVVCSENPECKMEEDLPKHESAIAGSSDLEPDFNIPGEKCRLCSVDSIGSEPVLNDPSMGDTMLDDKQIMDFPMDIKEQSCGANGVFTSEFDVKTSVVSTNVENVQVEDGGDSDNGQPNVSNDADKKALVEVPDGHNREDNEGQGLILPEDLENKKVDDSSENSTEASIVSCATIEMKAADVVYHPCVDSLSSMQSDCGSQKFPLQHNGHLASLESSTLFSVPIKYQRHSITDALSDVDVNGISEKQYQEVARTFTDSVGPPQILRGYPVSVQTVNEMNGDFNCIKHVPLPNVPKRDGNLNLIRNAEFSLRRCTTGLRNHSQNMPVSSLSGCSSDVDKPPSSRNGDVKLFGKILISSQEKTNSRDRDDNINNNDVQHHDNKADHHRQSLTLKFSGDEKVNLDSFQSKVDCNNYPVSENNNIPFEHFSFRSKNKTLQAPIFPPLPDSTLLLAKYPAAFSNHLTPTVKVDQTPLNSVIRTNDHPFNGIADCQLLRSRELQPFTVDNVKSPQNVLFSEMQRINEFSVLQGLPYQQARSMVGVDFGRAGVLVGGQCSGVSDPVTAIKMHYAKAHSAKAGNMIRDDETR